MKSLVLILIVSIQVFALNIYLNSAKENGLTYAILHIVDDGAIECHTVPLALDKKNYICKFNKIVKTKIEEKKLRLVNIDFLEKNSEFYIKIDPKYNSKLLSLNEKLYDTKEVMDEKGVMKSKHWVILLYKKPPFGKVLKTEGINFPVTYDKYQKPSIGPVDLNGAPISYIKSKDINYYLEIQREFRDKDYNNVIKDIDRVLKQYPTSIFKSDLLLYKLKSMDISIEKNISPVSDRYSNSDVTKLAKSWIREFSSSESIPQVLLILVKSYLRSESSSDANYFLDILITEHKNSPYAKKAILYYADSLYNKNNKIKAMKLYEDVLYSAKNLDIASLAAIRLANSNINMGKSQKAKEYLLKVLNANKNYLLRDKEATSRLAVKLAANGLERIAATLNDLLLKNLSKGEYSTKELLLKQAGDWYAKAGDTNKAYDRYKEYKKDYKNGIYINEVNKAIDRLFFKMKDSNETKLLNYYNLLIKKYNNDIKDKAVIEKAKLLLKQKKYQNVIEMKSLLLSAVDKNSTTAKDIITKASVVLINKDLKESRCQKAINLLEENSINMYSIDDSNRLFECLMITARYKKARSLSESKLKIDNLKKKFIWLENLVIAYQKLQKYDKIISLKNDLFKLSKIINKPIIAPVYRDLFNSYFYKKMYNQALNILQKLDRQWPNDIKNIESYYKMANYANSMREDLLQIGYLKKIIFLQKKYSINYYSPKVEFMYIDALKRLSKLQVARRIAENLRVKKLSYKDKSRVLYELGELNLKLKDTKKAKKYFSECSQIPKDNSWKGLCKDNLQLF
ncbi:MAG: hypothetical protein QM482_05270 [Sulfurospirillum sp.]